MLQGLTAWLDQLERTMITSSEVKIPPPQIDNKQNNVIESVTALLNCRKIQHYTNGCTTDFCKPPAQGSTVSNVLSFRVVSA